MNIIIFNSSGEILRSISCPEEAIPLQLSEGESYIVGEADVANDAIDVASGAVIQGGRVRPAKPPVTYSQARRAAYPRIEEQLDMLWHAMDADESVRLEPFYSIIKLVKDSNPKGPDEVFEVGGS